MRTTNLDKLRASGPFRTFLCVVLATMLMVPMSLTQAVGTAYASDSETTHVTYKVVGDGTLTVELPDGTTTEASEAAPAETDQEVGTYATVTGEAGAGGWYATTRNTDDTFDVNEPDASDAEGVFKEVTYAGTDKVVTIYLGAAAQEAQATAAQATETASVLRSSRASDAPWVGRQYTGVARCTYVDGGNGHTVHSVSLTGSTGILAGTTLTGYCADHGMAAPYAGTDWAYTATVTSIDYATGTVHCSVSYTGLGDVVHSDGYQRLEGTMTFHYDFGGYLQVQKTSANPAITDGNDCYSFEGAVFKVYDASGAEVATLTTGADGRTGTTGILMAGTYTVKEVSAPKGYALADDQTVTVNNDGQTVTVTFEDTPLNDPASIIVGKYDADIDEYYGLGADKKNVPEGAASLEGAEFTVRYYDGFYDTAEDAEASGNPTKTWILKTNNRGFTRLADDFKIGGDSFYYAVGNPDPVLPRGTLLIQETKAPEGYNLNSQVYVQQVKKPGDATLTSTYNEPQVPDQVKRGDLEFVKTNEASQERLANVAFQITSRTTGESHVVVTDENGYFSTASSNVAHSADTNKNDEALRADGTIDDAKLNADYGVWFGLNGDGAQVAADDAKGALPYDTYDIQELACTANEGLQLIHATAIVSRDSFTVDLGTMDDPEPIIATRATDKADGDKYVAQDDTVTVVDRVSYSNLIPNKAYTLDAQFVDKATGAVVAKATKTFTPEQSSGYVNVEVSANTLDLADHDLVVFETLSCDGRILVEHKDADDADQTVTVVPPEIGTSAADGVDADRTVVADTEASVVDTVSYSGLVPGKEYTVTGTLMVKGYDDDGGITQEPLKNKDGSDVTASVTFTPQKSSGTVEVTFSFDASAIQDNTELVAFESLNRAGKEIAVHTDIEDKGQTVKVKTPKIGTTAVDGVDGDKIVAADPEATLTDTVSYTGLLTDVEYTLHGELMNKSVDESGNVTATPVLDADGNPVVVDKTFSVYDSHGTTDVTFSFDASGFTDGDELVVYETLLRGDTEIASHKDPADEGQTVSILHPSVGTTAADGVDGDKNVVADRKATVVDTVTYKNVVPGKEYTVTGTLMVKKGADNSASSADKADQKQLDQLADLWNTIVKESTGEEPSATPEDPAGSEAEPLLDADGNPVTASVTFTPDDTYGTVEVTFEFDASLLTGKDVVAFESLSRNAKEVAVHADITDEGQTVTVVQSEISTTAVDGLDGDKNVVADGKASIKDTVAYTNLIPGGQYEAWGVVMDKATGLPLLAGEGAQDISSDELKAFMDKLAAACGFGTLNNDGQFTPNEQADSAVFTPLQPDIEALSALMADNADIANHMVIANTAFTPEHADGSVDVMYNFDASNFIQAQSAADTVVFELLVKDNSVVATHADLEDEGQKTTIVPSSISTTATDKSDGDHSLLPSKDTVVVDTVTYTDLIPGKEYEVQGVLMDKSTGKPLMVNDKQVTSSVKFTPNEANGSVELAFTFDSTGLVGKDLVVFETLYKEGVEVAVHADINDENQTVTIEEQPEGSVFDKTGDFLNQYGWVLALLAAAAAAAGAYGLHQRKLAKAEGEHQSANNKDGK